MDFTPSSVMSPSARTTTIASWCHLQLYYGVAWIFHKLWKKSYRNGVFGALPNIHHWFADSWAKGSSVPSDTKSTLRPNKSSKSLHMPKNLRPIGRLLSKSTMISTSLSGVCSSRENDPNSHAFKTGYALKYSAKLFLIISVVILKAPLHISAVKIQIKCQTTRSRAIYSDSNIHF